MNKAGHITIPAINVPWFNTTTGKEETASLPALTIDVTASSTTATTTNPPTSPKSGNKPTPSNKPNTVLSETTQPSQNIVWWIVIGFVSIWLLTIPLWWLQRHSYRLSNKRQILKRLHNACINNDPAKARTSLLQWATIQCPDAKILDLNDLSRLVHDIPLEKQIYILSQALYSREKQLNWQGSDLWQSVQAFLRKKATKKAKKDTLPPINPS